MIAPAAVGCNAGQAARSHKNRSSRYGPLGAFNHENVARSLRCLQFQPKLLGQRLEDRLSCIGWSQAGAKWANRLDLDCFKFEIEKAGEPRLINDGAVDNA